MYTAQLVQNWNLPRKKQKQKNIPYSKSYKNKNKNITNSIYKILPRQKKNKSIKAKKE